MSWFKVDDQLAFHAKVIAAGNEALGLWVRAASWSCSQGTDGFIPNEIVNAIASQEFANRLLLAKLWSRVDDGYQFHDWADFQPSAAAEREKRAELRKVRSVAGKKGANARWGDGKGVAIAKANAKQNDGPDPDPLDISKEISIEPEQPTQRSRRKPSVPLPNNWVPNQTHREKCTELGLNLEDQVERFRNNAHAKDHRYVNWNAAFNTWLSKAKDFQPRPRQASTGGSPYARDPVEDALNLARLFHEQEMKQQPLILEEPHGESSQQY